MALAGGVLAFSSSGVLAKMCGAEAIAIAFWVRLFSLVYLIAALLLSTAAGRSRSLSGALLPGAVGGCLFAVHLVFFFQALKLTSVTVVFLLSSINPALVGVAGAFLLGERPTARQALWTAVAVGAAGCLSMMKDASGTLHGLGNFFAVLATLGYCGYFLFTRKARQTVGNLEYMTVVTATSLLVIVLTGFALHASFQPGDARDVQILALMGLVPATSGHLLVNWSLRHVPAYRASSVLLAVPVFASLWAALLVGERISFPQVVAGIVILAAIPGALGASSEPPKTLAAPLSAVE